jgi:hypothetical protein
LYGMAGFHANKETKRGAKQDMPAGHVLVLVMVTKIVT